MSLPGRPLNCSTCNGKSDHAPTCYGRATLRNALHIESEFPGRGHGVRYVMEAGSAMFDVDGLDGLRASIRAAQRAPDVYDEESLVALLEAELRALAGASA